MVKKGIAIIFKLWFYNLMYNKSKEKKMKCLMCNREIAVKGKEKRFARHIGVNSPLEFGRFSAGSIKNSNGTECYGSNLPSDWTKDFVDPRFLNWRKYKIEWTQREIAEGKYKGKDLIYVQKILETEIKKLNKEGK